MSDDEVFGLAVHYYDEDDIKVNKQTNYKAATSQAPKSDVGASPQKETGCPEKMNSRRKGKKNESSSLQFSLLAHSVIILFISGSWLLKPTTLNCNFVLGFIILQIMIV